MATLKQAISETVNGIFKTDGEVKPSALVEASRPKSSPTHDAFEWDNKKAGSEFRLIQARNWIRKVQIVYEDRTERLIHVNIVHGLTGSSEGYYKPVSIVVGNRPEFEAAMNETLSRLNSTKEAYSVLKSAATEANNKKHDFKKADKGFDMVETALTA